MATPSAPEPFDPVKAAQQQRKKSRKQMRALMAWIPPDLLDIYIKEWVRSGDGELAWATVRTSKKYEQHFPGIRRDDGTLRMTEHEYFSHREAFHRELIQWGLNPEAFAGHHEELVRGEVSVTEMRQRIDAKATGVLRNADEVRSRFSAYYGVLDTDEALIAAALDADVGLALLEGRITAAQIGGEALMRGFDRDVSAAERLANVGGLSQADARRLFSQAQAAVPRFGRFAERFRDSEGFGIGEFEEASVFGDADIQQRMRRLHSSETALFTQGGLRTRQESGAVTGLRRA
jgi:hypothetical protein